MHATDLWRDWDAATVERAYSPSSCIGGNYQTFVAAYRAQSDAARAVLDGQIAAGQLRHSRVGIAALFVPTSPNAAPPPLLVFIHGGYWQELGLADSLFAAPGCMAHGAAFAALDYRLAPAVSVAQIVDDCCDAVAQLQAQATELGFDPQRIVVAGSSAGAHLAAMVAMRMPQTGHPLRGTVLVSGIYDLEPLVGTSINDALGLDVATAVALSPARQIITPPLGISHIQSLLSFYSCQNIICWGEIETAEFKRQSHDFANTLHALGAACEQFEVPGKNHFDIILDLTDPHTTLGSATLRLLHHAALPSPHPPNR